MFEYAAAVVEIESAKELPPLQLSEAEMACILSFERKGVEKKLEKKGGGGGVRKSESKDEGESGAEAEEEEVEEDEENEEGDEANSERDHEDD